jgi:hypothetical protein
MWFVCENCKKRYFDVRKHKGRKQCKVCKRAKDLLLIQAYKKRKREENKNAIQSKEEKTELLEKSA